MAKKKDLQGEIKPVQESYLAINGKGFFAVCKKNNINSENKCEHVDFTRNGAFKKKIDGLVNNENEYLLGYKVSPPIYVEPYHYSEEFINKVMNKDSSKEITCFAYEKEQWQNGTFNKNCLIDYKKPVTISKKKELEIIDLNEFKFGDNIPTTYIKFNKLNLTPKGSRGEHKNHEGGYKFRYFDYLDEFYVNEKNNITLPLGIKYDVFSIYNEIFQPHFIQKVEIFDSCSNSRFIESHFIKKANNKWGVEMFPSPGSKDDIVLRTPIHAVLAQGELIFNDYGKLSQINGHLDEVNILWKDGCYNKVNLLFGLKKNAQFLDSITQIGGINYSGKDLVIEDAKSYITGAKIYISNLINDPSVIEIDGSSNDKKLKSYKVDIDGKLFIIYNDNTMFNSHIIPFNFNFIDKTTYQLGKLIQVTGFNDSKKKLAEIVFNAKEESHDKNDNKKYDLEKVDFIKKSQGFSEFYKYEKKEDSNYLTIEGKGFMLIKCGNKFYLTKNFKIYDINELKSLDNCYLLGKNLESDSEFVNKKPKEINKIFADNIDNFHYLSYYKKYSPTSKIYINKIILDHKMDVINQDKNQVIQTNITTTINAKDYDAQSKDLNIAHGTYKTQTINKIVIELFDSIGEGHPVFFGFAKVSSTLNNKMHREQTWKMEIYEQIDVDMPSKNKLIAHGNINFDENGVHISHDASLDNIYINMDNGALPLNISIIWANNGYKASELDFRGIGTYNNDGDKKKNPKNEVVSDGFKTKLLQNIYLENNSLIAKYGFNDEQKIFEIPVADVENEHALAFLPGNYGYLLNEDIGYIDYYLAGAFDMGRIVTNYSMVFEG